MSRADVKVVSYFKSEFISPSRPPTSIIICILIVELAIAAPCQLAMSSCGDDLNCSKFITEMKY